MTTHPWPKASQIARIIEINEKLAKEEIRQRKGLAWDALLRHRERDLTNPPEEKL